MTDNKTLEFMRIDNKFQIVDDEFLLVWDGKSFYAGYARHSQDWKSVSIQEFQEISFEKYFHGHSWAKDIYIIKETSQHIGQKPAFEFEEQDDTDETLKEPPHLCVVSTGNQRGECICFQPVKDTGYSTGMDKHEALSNWMIRNALIKVSFHDE